LILGLDSSDVSDCDQSDGDASGTYGKKKQPVISYEKMHKWIERQST